MGNVIFGHEFQETYQGLKSWYGDTVSRNGNIYFNLPSPSFPCCMYIPNDLVEYNEVKKWEIRRWLERNINGDILILNHELYYSYFSYKVDKFSLNNENVSMLYYSIWFESEDDRLIFSLQWRHISTLDPPKLLKKHTHYIKNEDGIYYDPSHQ